MEMEDFEAQLGTWVTQIGIGRRDMTLGQSIYVILMDNLSN